MRAEFSIRDPVFFSLYKQLGWCLVARLNLNIGMRMYAAKSVSLLGPSFRLVQKRQHKETPFSVGVLGGHIDLSQGF